MAARTLLRVRGLHAGYGRAEVLHGLDVTADEGQVITVIGPNGAGKSTLLNALMGALPSRGTVEYQGESVALLSLEERVWRGMALVPETRALFATMSVEDNLLLGAWRRFRVGVKRIFAPSRCSTSAKRAGASTVGTRARPHCFTASKTMRSQRSLLPE